MMNRFLIRCLIILGIFILTNSLLLSKSKYIVVSVYEESNYCHALTFKNIIKKLENKDNSNFYLVLKNLDNLELDFVKKDYPNINFIENSDFFKLGDFFEIFDTDTTKYFVAPNCEERFKTTIIDTVISNLNCKNKVININENGKIPIFSIQDFPFQSIFVNDSLALLMDVRNTLHEINLNTGKITYQYQLKDTLIDKYTNISSEYKTYIDFYYKSGHKFFPQNCLYINNTKYFRFAGVCDAKLQVANNDSSISPVL